MHRTTNGTLWSLFLLLPLLHPTAASLLSTATLTVQRPTPNTTTGLRAQLHIQLCVEQTTQHHDMDQIHQFGVLGVFLTDQHGDVHLWNQLDIQEQTSMMEAWAQQKEQGHRHTNPPSCFFQYLFKVDVLFTHPGAKTLTIGIFDKRSTQQHSSTGIQLLLPRTQVSWNTEVAVKEAAIGTTEWRQRYFEQVYSSCTWQSDFNGSCSGWSKPELTRHTQEALREVLLHPELGIQHFLDAPCGDMQYMATFMDALREDIQGRGGVHVHHHGADIVAGLVEGHRQRYGHRKWSGSFQHTDFVSAASTEFVRANGKPYDLIFSRQMTQHLSQNETCAVLRTFNRSGARFLLATTYLHEQNGQGLVWEYLSPGDIGNYDRQNLLRPPFQLPPPLYLARDDPMDAFVYLGLWRLPLPGSVCSFG